MIFKNATIYTVTRPFDLTEEELSNALFTPCALSQPVSQGFVNPHGFNSLVAEVSGNYLICLKTEEKILPAAAVNKKVAERVAAIEAAETRQVYRKERTTIKDDVIHDMLGRAFTKDSLLHALYIPAAGLLIVDTASFRKAEELLSLLREALGSLPVVPARTNNVPQFVLTNALNNAQQHGFTAGGFESGSKIKLFDRHGGATTTYNKQLLELSDEIAENLNTGKLVEKMELSLPGKASFMLNEGLQLTGIKFDDAVFADMDDESDDAEHHAKATLILVATTLHHIINKVADLMGGFVETGK